VRACPSASRPIRGWSRSTSCSGSRGWRALVAGDTLIDRGKGFEFPTDWANKGVPPEQILETLRPLLGLPVAFVLPTHGPPAGRADLERALS
jgi:glyoxylase-like metal-dependent hydrolase (beta-lactamase superfamily II)